MVSPLWITAKSGTGKLMGELAFAWRSFTVWIYIVFHYVLNLSLWWESQKLLQVSCVPCPHSFGLLLPWKQMLRLPTDMWNNSLLFSDYKLFPFWVFPCLKTGTCWCRIIGSNPIFMSSLFLQGISLLLSHKDSSPNYWCLLNDQPLDANPSLDFLTRMWLQIPIDILLQSWAMLILNNDVPFKNEWFLPPAHRNILLSMTFLIILGFLPGLKSLVIPLIYWFFYHVHRNEGGGILLFP